MNQTTDQTTPEPTAKFKFLRVYRELFNPEWRNIVYYGGRGSGKSQHVALALLLRGRTEKHLILCTRELQKSIADSVHALLSQIIDRNGFTDYVVTDKEIRNTETGTTIIFKGLKHNSSEIKSTEGITICWVEEAQSISDASLKILAPTVRGGGSQLIFTFNRLSELDPVYVRYVQKKRSKTYVLKVNYDVLEKAGLFPDELKLEMQDDMEDPNTFAHVWLGEPLAQLDNAIIGRDKALLAMQREVNDEGGYEVGVDVARFGNDRTVFYKRKGLKIVAEKTYKKLRTTEVCKKLEAFIEFDKDVPLKIDDTGVGGGVTDGMIEKGYTVIPINFGEEATDPDKYPNLISEAWFYLEGIIDEIQLPMDDELLMELSNRLWLQDKKSRRGVESKKDYKKRGNKSPDKADALILCFYNRGPQSFEYESEDDKDDDYDDDDDDQLLDDDF